MDNRVNVIKVVDAVDADTTIRDIMTPDPVGVYFDQTISETARIMRDAQVGAVLVVSGESLTAW
jgi:CBS domain-containing protein